MPDSPGPVLPSIDGCATTPGEPTDRDGRVWLRGQTPPSAYPRVEHFIGATLAGTADKQRRSFDKQWSDVTGDKLFDLT